MLKEYFNKIATYLTETFGVNFLFFTILITTVTSIVYFVVITYIITQLDKRYFLRKNIDLKNNGKDDGTEKSHSTLMSSGVNYLVEITKIIAGVCLLVSGIIMLVLPGQGLITMLIGLSLLPFPGKNRMEQNLLSQKSVRSSLNWIRIKANKEPFIFD